jgi:hypothetical protein
LIEYPPAPNCPGGGWVGAADSGISPYAVPGTLQNTVVRWDLSGIPSTAVITSATLSGYQNDELGVATKEVSVTPVTTDWDSSADWLYPWSTIGGDFGSEITTISSPGNGNWSTPVDVTATVADWVSGATDNYGFGLTIPGADRDTDLAVEFSDFDLDIDYYVP